MERVVVVVVMVMGLLIAVSSSAQSMAPYPPQGASCPERTLTTRMVPCVKTDVVAEVIPVTKVIPVKRIGYRMQNVMLKGIPVGQPCGINPCLQCCPQPFSQVVQQRVPYEYYEPKTIRTFDVVYRPVQRPVMLPQNYMVEAIPMCR